VSDRWRLALSNSVVVDVCLTEWDLGDAETSVDGWEAECVWCIGRARRSIPQTVQRLAYDLLLLCEGMGLDVRISCVLAPGELTPDERVTAERERCAAIAESVARERDSRADMAVMDRAEVRHRDVATTARDIAAAIRKGV